MKKALVVILAVMMMFSVIAYDEGNIAVADSLKDTFVFVDGRSA